MTIILPTHLPSIYLLLATVLACFLAGRTLQRSCRLLSTIVLPVGIVGTFVGFIFLLCNMSDLSQLAKGFTATLPTALYAAIVKIAIDVYAPAPLPLLADESDSKLRSRLAVAIWLASFVLFYAEIAADVSFILSLDVLGVLGVCAALIIGLNKLAGENITSSESLVQTLPKVGLLAMVYSVFTLPSVISNPSEIGPLMAFGLVIYLYSNIFAVIVKLARPEICSDESPIAQWLAWSAALACMGAYFVGLLIAFI